MMKKIMILAGGNDQAALIQELRKFFKGDVHIILIDMSTNVRAIKYADTFLPISTMDKDAVLEAAQKEKIDYILTACGDQPLSTMAYVSAKMGIPSYLSEQDVQNLTNKRYMKDIMVKNDIPTAKHVYINKFWKKEDISNISYPLVVKPVDSNGSKGVKKVEKESELISALDEAFQYSISKDVIVEEYKEGEELSVDVYIEGTKAKVLLVTNSKKIKENIDSFTIIQSYYSPNVLYNEERVQEIVQQITDVFQLHDTPLLVQMIKKGNEYYVVEFSARMGGGSKYNLIERLTGVNIMEVYVKMVMGEKPHVNPQKIYNNAIMNYVYCSPGKYCSILGFDECINKGIILDYFTYRMPNSIIEKSTTSSDRVAGFLVVGNDEEEVNKKMNEANSQLKVLNENGDDIMRHDLF